MPLRRGSPMPSLAGATEWVNGEPQQDALKGSITIVHFWSISCQVCKDNMPQVQIWRDTYLPKGLKLVAVHMPRQESDLDIQPVKDTIAEKGITEFCAIDNDHKIAEAFENEFVPAYFLFDEEGNLVSRTAGYHGIGMVTASLEKLMADK